MRSGVIHPGKHIPATAGKIQLGNYGKFWEELVEGRVEYLHDGTRPTSRFWVAIAGSGGLRTKSLKLLKHGKTFTRAALLHNVWFGLGDFANNTTCANNYYCVVYSCDVFDVFLHGFWHSRIGGAFGCQQLKTWPLHPRKGPTAMVLRG